MVFWMTLGVIVIIWLVYALWHVHVARTEAMARCPYCGRTAVLEEIERGGIFCSPGAAPVRACKECLYGKDES